MRKMFELQTFLQIVDNVSDPNANQKEFATLTVCKNVIEKFMTITTLLK